MALLAWSMMGIAIWHFTVFLPDKFWGGIVGAFAAALFGAVLFAFIVNGFGIPSRADTNLLQAFVAIPGCLIGLGICYWAGTDLDSEDSDAT